MELFQVRYFLALSKTLNFTRAAEACHVSQPALTRAIQRLEEEFGGPLLFRERNLTQLTPLGRAMMPHLEGAYAAATTAATEATAFRKREASPLRIGLGEGLSAHLLTPSLLEIQNRIKGFEFSLIEGGAEVLAEKMLSDALDAALLVDGEELPERLNRWPLFEDRYAVVCLADHPFAKLAEVPVAALDGQPILLPGALDSHVRQFFAGVCGESGIKPDMRHKGSSETMIQQMVAAGLGLGLAALHRPLAPNLVAVPLDDPSAKVKVALAAVAGRPHGPSLAVFLKLMRARDWQSALADGAIAASASKR